MRTPSRTVGYIRTTTLSPLTLARSFFSLKLVKDQLVMVSLARSAIFLRPTVILTLSTKYSLMSIRFPYPTLHRLIITHSSHSLSSLTLSLKFDRQLKPQYPPLLTLSNIQLSHTATSSLSRTHPIHPQSPMALTSSTLSQLDSQTTSLLTCLIAILLKITLVRLPI